MGHRTAPVFHSAGALVSFIVNARAGAVTMGNSYGILHKNQDGSYSCVRVVDGREQAEERMRLLNSKLPGEYLLLDLTTKIIEDESDIEASQQREPSQH